MSDQPDYFRDVMEKIFVKNFLEEDGLTKASKFWQRKGSEAANLIQIVNDRYAIVDEYIQLGSYKKRTFNNFIQHLPIVLQLNHMLKKYCNDANILNLGKKITEERKIIFEYDHVKQLLCCDVMNKLELFSNCKMICIIGDGYGYVTTLTKRMFPEKTVICVNLGKMLIFDVICCELNFDSHNSSNTAYLARESGDIEDSNNGGIYFLEAENCHLLRGLPISLFINICSMQEMDMDVIKDYFSIMRSSSVESYFYSCNRVEKKFKDGSCISFNEYPWSENDKILIDEICPWIQKRPMSRYPFSKKFQPHKHRAVKLKPNK